MSTPASDHFLSCLVSRGFLPKSITSLFPFFGFTLNLHFLLYDVTISSISCKSLLLSASSTMSSAYNNNLTRVSPTQTPCVFSLISLASPLMKNEKRTGDITHPCRTPVCRSNALVCSLPAIADQDRALHNTVHLSYHS